MSKRVDLGPIKYLVTDDESMMLAFENVLNEFDSDHRRTLLGEFLDTERTREDRKDFIKNLMDALDECSPEFCYFGTNSDGIYGYWPVPEITIPEIFRNLTVVEKTLPPPFAVKTDYALVILDEGKRITLYSKKDSIPWIIEWDFNF